MGLRFPLPGSGTDRNQEVLKTFFRFCVKSDFILKTPAADLDYGALREELFKTDEWPWLLLSGPVYYGHGKLKELNEI